MSIFSGLILTSRSFISCFLEWAEGCFGVSHSSFDCLEAKEVTRLKAGECKVVAGSVFSHLNCSMNSSCRSVLATWLLSPGPRKELICQRLAVTAWWDASSVIVCREKQRRRFKNQPNQDQGRLHLSTKQDHRNCHTLLEHWSIEYCVLTQMLANTRGFKPWNKALCSRQP